MKPIDYRNETFDAIRERISGLREQVWHALLNHGPCTTRELAHRSGIDILTLRPRITELYQIGLAVMVEDYATKGEGRYRACNILEARQIFDSRQQEATTGQLEMQLGV